MFRLLFTRTGVRTLHMSREAVFIKNVTARVQTRYPAGNAIFSPGNRLRPKSKGNVHFTSTRHGISTTPDVNKLLFSVSSRCNTNPQKSSALLLQNISVIAMARRAKAAQQFPISNSCLSCTGQASEFAVQKKVK